jgi:hypothetical protein
MAMNLESIKKLRERGASVQMQEDLASFLDGGYDSELFLPTIDFILTLKNPPKSQQTDIQQEQSVDLSEFDIPQVYDPKYFEKISIKAAGEIIKASTLEEQLRQEILAYLDNMEIQRAQNMGVLGSEEPEANASRAKISETRRKDRGTKNVKSMFEALVNGLNALQVRITQQNSVKKAQQENFSKLNRIQNIIAQRLHHEDDHHKHGKHDDHGKMAKVERSFLKKMRKVGRPDKKNNEGNNSDSQQARAGGRDKEFDLSGKAVSDVAHKYDQAQEHAAKSADDYKSAESKKDIKVMASKTIDDTKKAGEAEKGGGDKSAENTRTESRLRNTNLQQRLQRTRLRLQRQQDEQLRNDQSKNESSQHKESGHHKDSGHHSIDDMTAQKAVAQLKNMGVSMKDGDIAKLNNKELSQVAKLQDKNRGG